MNQVVLMLLILSYLHDVDEGVFIKSNIKFGTDKQPIKVSLIMFIS
jgi:hypothetical protein